MHAARSHPLSFFDRRRLRRLAALVGLLAVLAFAVTLLTGVASSDPVPSPYRATGHHGAPRRVVAPVAIVAGETWAADESARGTPPERAH